MVDRGEGEVYKYYMGKAKTNYSDAPMIRYLFRGIDEFAYTGSTEELKQTDKYLLDFDVDQFSNELNDWLTKMEISSCMVNIHRSPKENKPFLIIDVADDEARKVSAWLKYLADIHDMFVLDPISDKRYASRDLFDDDIITMRARGEAIGSQVRERFPNIAFFDEFDHDYTVRWEHYHYYVLVLRPDASASLEDMIASFNDLLRESLLDGEELKCDGKCFTVKPKEWPRWEIVYSLEFDCDDKCVRGYVSEDNCVVEKLDRPSFLKVKEIVHGHEDGYDIYDRLSLDEMMKRYPDPIDRFHRSLDISNKLDASGCSVAYARHDRISSGVVFHLVSYDFRTGSSVMEKSDSASILSIDHYSADPIVEVISEFYPYIWDTRYYRANHLPIQMWPKIKDRMLEIKEILQRDPFSPELAEHADKFHFPKEYYSGESKNKEYDESRIKYWAEYTVKLIDIFVKWLDAQMEVADWPDMINVEGP